MDLLNVSKRYGAVSVIDGLSLRVEPNEFMVFLGSSGCGKSTLLRMIAGLESLDGGEIHIGGDRVDTLPPGRRGVAMVFQQYALYPHMTIRQNMAFGLENVGTPTAEIARRVAEAAESLEITPLLDRRPGQLSGGQRQRVAIGRAIVKEPKVFLFDEPLSNLDAGLRSRTRIELARLHRRLSSTMIFVTHDQVEAMTLADRIVVMNAGKIEQIGAPMDIYNHPATTFVAGFVGSPTINLLPASLTDQANVVRLGDGAVVRTRPVVGGDPGSAGALRLGVRPEALKVGSPEAGTPATVDVVERLGDRTFLHARLSDGAPVVAEDAAATTVRPGDTVGLIIDGAACHLFADDGRNLLEPARG